MGDIHIQFTRFSAFYTPLIATMAGGFLKEEGLDWEWSISPPGKSAIEALLSGEAQVCQSAPSQALSALARGEVPAAVHFAQINEKDGFFVTGRAPDPDFSWNKLEGADVLVDHGGQPLAMFKYACHEAGIDFAKINAINVGNAAEMDTAFRSGTGDYIHQQGPAPQQLEFDKVGHIVAEVGLPIGPCAFSSLAATREWLNSDMARAFMAAYRKARTWINSVPADEVADAERDFFPDIEPVVLANTIGTYQRLGCWTPHVEITPQALEVTQDVFTYVGRLTERYAYDQVCALPPASD